MSPVPGEIATRPAILEDSSAIAEIYNEGIEERVATFETALRTPDDVGRWLSGTHPVVVSVSGGKIVSFAAAFPYSTRSCYSGIAEFSVYVSRNHRRIGAGRASMERLIKECKSLGFWKLVSRVFVENEASRALLRSLGFREVGIYEKHGKLDGRWRDTVIVELLFPENAK